MLNQLDKTSIADSNTKESLKFTRLTCLKCGNIVSKDFILCEKIILTSEKKGLYVSKLIYFKCIFLDKEIHFINELEFLFQKVKCVQCNAKIGKFVKSATDKSWDLLDSILFSTENLKL